ncbi:MAG: hypothetical protein GX880_08130 [Methanomicrobiales archaeon]|nr:hypothetical protein [Methanomicrobiales archaeon]
MIREYDLMQSEIAALEIIFAQLPGMSILESICLGTGEAEAREEDGDD